MECHVPNGITGLIPVGAILGVVPLHLGGVAIPLDGVGIALVIHAALECTSAVAGSGCSYRECN